MIEKIDNFADQEIRSVRDYLSRHGRIQDTELIRALVEYFKILRAHHVSCFADRPENMGIVVDPHGKTYIKCFDVKTYLDHQLLPINKIEYFRKRRIQRRLNRHFSILSGENIAEGARI